MPHLFSDIDIKHECGKPKTFCMILGVAVFFFSVGTLFQSSYGSQYRSMIVESMKTQLLGPSSRSTTWCPSNSSNCFPNSSSSYVPTYPASIVPSITSTTTSPSVDTNQVLLVTYGRSGSSFTSALISHHKDVFFVFEPLHILKGSRTPLKVSETKENASLAVVKAYLSCEFPRDYISALLNMFSGRTPETRDVSICLKSKLPGTSHVSCFLKFLENCSNKKMTFIKTIRFRIAWTEWFLKNNPGFKLLYLIRDPRATLYSQARNFGTVKWKGSDITNVSESFCKKISTDLVAAERLQKLYPNRVKGIRYEMGALDPYAYTKDIYDFLGLEYDTATENYVYSLTNHSAADNRTRHAYSVVRANSSETMNKWRYSAGFTNVSKIDAICGYLYSKLGYKAVKSKEDLLSSRSLVGTPDPGGIF